MAHEPAPAVDDASRTGSTGPQRYSEAVESIEASETETFQKIADQFAAIAASTQAQGSGAIRTSHAKSTALIKAHLTVAAGLPADLAQGLFAKPAEYEVLIRFAQGPGEILDDDTSTHRGMAIKILNVREPRIAESIGRLTQDWLFEAGEHGVSQR